MHDSVKRDDSPKRTSHAKQKEQAVCYCNNPDVDAERYTCHHCKSRVCKHCYYEIVEDCYDADSCIKCMKLDANPVPKKYGRPRRCGKLYYQAYLEKKKAQAPREDDTMDY